LTVRSSSGGSGEGRHGVGAIPAKKGRKLDQIRSGSWWRRCGSGVQLGFGRGGAVAANSGEECSGGLGVARRKKRKTGEGKGFGSGFIEAHCFIEERERRSGHGIGLRTAGGACVPLGCVAAARHRQPNVAERGTASGGSAGGGRSGGATRGRGKGGADLQQLGKRPAAAGHARGRGRGDRGLEEDDGGPKSKKQKS
jgi:hypothetical protein